MLVTGSGSGSFGGGDGGRVTWQPCPRLSQHAQVHGGGRSDELCPTVIIIPHIPHIPHTTHSPSITTKRLEVESTTILQSFIMSASPTKAAHDHAALTASLAAAADKYPKPDKVSFSYGTAGFRTL